MKLTLKEVRQIIRQVIKEQSDVVQSVALSSEVDSSIKALINAAATELRDLDQAEFKKLAGNRQAVAGLKSALNQALRQGLSNALKAAPAAPAKPAAPAAPQAQPGQVKKN